MKDNRERIYLAAFCAVVAGWVILETAMLPPPPLDDFHVIALLCLIAAGAAAAAGIAWAWHSGPMAQKRLDQRELAEAIELAAVMMIDQDGIIRHWSRGCEEVYGWAAHEAIGRPRAELLHSDRLLSMREIQSLILDEGRADYELIERHRDGRLLGTDNHVRLFDHRDGRFSTVYAVTDATARRSAEINLRLSELRLATAVVVQGIFIFEYDILAQKPVWLSRGESFFGLAAPDEEPLPQDTVWAWSEQQTRSVRRIIAKAIKEQQSRAHFDFDFVYPDGTLRRAEGWIKVIRNSSGTATRLLGTYLDVTERREQEALLRAGEAEKRAILATVPDAMLVCSDAGIIRSCSATAEELFGHSATELIGCSLIDLVADAQGRQSVRRDLMRAFRRARTTPWPMSANVRCADGGMVPVSFVVGQAVVEGTRMFVIFGRDMRPTITAEEKFHRLRSDLAQVSRLGMMGEMAGALAHELSQPLAAIVNFLGAVELMLDRDSHDKDQLRFAVQCAGEQATRAGEIIRRLRAFILRGEADMRAEPLCSLVREAAALALFNTPSLGLRLTYAFEDEDRVILGDRIQIQQVLVNLIRNAADAMTGSGSERREMVIATVLVGDGLVEVSVRDSGPGIAPEMLEKLFSPFATTKREGLGFGLAISRRIVEGHGGQLVASGAPTGGAIFRFTLPVME